MGSTLSLALSESNIKSGYHYIILDRYKFKLKWELHQQHQRWPKLRSQRIQQQQQQQYIIRLYLVTNETYPALSNDRRCVFKISLNGKPQTINNGTPTGGSAVQGLFGRGGAAQGLFGGGGAAQGLFGGESAAQGLFGGGGAAQGAAQGLFGGVSAVQGLFGGGGAAQSVFGGGSAAQGLFGGGGAAQGVFGGGGAALGFVAIGGDDQLLGSVTLECDANIIAPTLDIQSDSLPVS